MGFQTDLEQEYIKFCDLKNSSLLTKKLDLSNVSWFYPTLLLPIGIYLNDNPTIDLIPPKDPLISTYFDIMLSGSVKNGKTYIPLIKIPKEHNSRTKIYDALISDQKGKFGGKNAFAFIIEELVNNIYDHSEFSTAFMMAQIYEKSEFTEISIIDNGISIPGSFKKKGYNFTDVRALKEALTGKSTKSDDEKGYGLRRCVKIFWERLNGQCLIISRNAAMTTDTDGYNFFKN